MIARYVGTPKVRSLYSVLWTWTGLLGSTAREWVAEDDCMWWYTERALVGTLAAASWMNGGQALLRNTRARRGVVQRNILAGVTCISTLARPNSSPRQSSIGATSV